MGVGRLHTGGGIFFSGSLGQHSLRGHHHVEEAAQQGEKHSRSDNMMWESFLLKQMVDRDRTQREMAAKSVQPVIFGKKIIGSAACCFLPKSYSTKYKIFDCYSVTLAYWKKVAIHNCCQRSEMRCRRTLEGVEKWLCSISEKEIRPDCGVLIIDRHLLSNTSCWSALKRWKSPDRFGCACPRLIRSVIRMSRWSSYSSFIQRHRFI